ncbi:MAG: FtsX-like permease family protein [Chthoniobacteraceae bacterium]
MNSWTILLQSVRYYWRTHLGVILGAALGAMVLTGALLIGDSVSATLKRQAELRIGKTENALVGGERFFRSDLAKEIGGDAAAVLLLRGNVSRADGSGRANQVQVIGADAPFFQLAPEEPVKIELGPNDVALNARLAQQLNAKAGDTVIVRVEKPGLFSRDAPLSGEENEVVALRLTVARILTDEEFGRFSLLSGQVPPFTAVLSLPVLQQRVNFAGRANLLLDPKRDAAAFRKAIQERWQLADAGLELKPLPNNTGVELRSGRVFLDPPVVQAAPRGMDSLTYLVNELRSGDKATPYSMVTAIDAPASSMVPAELADDEIAISQWLAEDLGVTTGAKIRLTYFVMGERRELQEQAREFTVLAIIPMDDPALNPSWMPDFPGLTDAENCRDWEPGFAMDMGKIRDKDEEYWDKYRGTPKAFVNIMVGQEMWGNRWGDLTSIRYRADVNPDQIASTLRAQLTPEQIGMTFVPVAEQAFAATDAPVDFGQLFLSFSFFLLVAAAVLTALLFVFSLEQRSDQTGLLLALGLPQRQVRRLFLAEGALLALIGSIIGVVAALAYTQVMLRALSTVWRGAVGGVEFAFRPQPASIVIGILGSVLIALFSMWMVSRRQFRQSARELLVSAGAVDATPAAGPAKRSWSVIVGAVAIVAAIAILAFGQASPGTFFGAGGLLLIGGLALGLAYLRKQARSTATMDSISEFGRRNAARRRGRSLATIAVLASGVFMVVAVDSFRHGPQEATKERRSGTGGFMLVGESALPIYEDLNTRKGQEALAIDPDEMQRVGIVPMRVLPGDDASCLNLNRALQPRLLGVRPSELQNRDAFRFTSPDEVSPEVYKSSAAQMPINADGTWTIRKYRWDALHGTLEDGAIPAIADNATIMWALQKKVGDTLDYQDERGQPFKVRLVGALVGSMLQGSLVISEANFIAKYPSQGGYRFFLIDADRRSATEVADHLSRSLADRGMEITPATRRLAEFQTVENTYLSIFQALGGLGLLLGSAGLAIVVGRNVLERRREFGLLEAIGYQPGQLRRLVLVEHRWLILAGLLIGTLSALVAVWPQLQERTSGFPLREM